MEKYTVSPVARLFNVTTDTVKKWTYLFPEYLSIGANPPKVNKRLFVIEDIRVMAYIYSFWEDEPDIESIKIGLNSNDHYDNEPIDNLILQISPFIIEMNDKIDETWKHGVLFGGISDIGDRFYLANSYKLAGDRLIDIALQNEELLDIFCPAVYNYRHATELYLKNAINYSKEKDKNGNGHKLIPLFEKFEIILKKEYNLKCPDWFCNIIITFNNFDSEGTKFRYGGNFQSDEVFIDFIQMKTLMGWMSEVFGKIKTRKQ